MINSVSGVSFRSNQDLISAPGRYSQQPANSLAMEADSFEMAGAEKKKSKKGLWAALGTAAVAIGALVGLGYAVKSGRIKAVEVPAEGFIAKAKAHLTNAANKVGTWGETCINKVAGWIGKGAKAAE